MILSSVGGGLVKSKVIAATRNSEHPLRGSVYLSMDEHTLYERWKKSQAYGDREGHCRWRACSWK